MKNSMMRKRKVCAAVMCVLAALCIGCFEDFYGDLLSDAGGKKVYITYDDNEATVGTVPTDGTAYSPGQTVTVLGNTGNLELTGKHFAGWNTASDGTGVTYIPGRDFSINSTDMVLYVKWTDTAPYALRDTGPAGGLIFYDKGSYTDGWRYLEAAPVSTEWTDKQWGAYGTLIGGTSNSMGYGKANTAIIVTWLNNNGESDRVAQVCDNLSYGGYSDWFLPSTDELNQIRLNLYFSGVGGFPANSYYWGSYEITTTHSLGMQMRDPSTTITAPKNNSTVCRVRAVRAF